MWLPVRLLATFGVGFATSVLLGFINAENSADEKIDRVAVASTIVNFVGMIASLIWIIWSV